MHQGTDRAAAAEALAAEAVAAKRQRQAGAAATTGKAAFFREIVSMGSASRASVAEDVEEPGHRGSMKQYVQRVLNELAELTVEERMLMPFACIFDVVDRCAPTRKRGRSSTSGDGGLILGDKDGRIKLERLDGQIIDRVDEEG